MSKSLNPHGQFVSGGNSFRKLVIPTDFEQLEKSETYPVDSLLEAKLAFFSEVEGPETSERFFTHQILSRNFKQLGAEVSKAFFKV